MRSLTGSEPAPELTHSGNQLIERSTGATPGIIPLPMRHCMPASSGTRLGALRQGGLAPATPLGLSPMSLNAPKPVLVLAMAAMCLMALLSPLAHADQPTQKDLEEILALMQANFDACNREDVNAIRATHHPMVPAAMLDKFEQEAKESFAEADVRFRLARLKVMNFQNPWLPGRVKMASVANTYTTTSEIEVIQVTLPSDHSYADLDEYPAQLSTDFRHKSALLPTHQVVEYTVKLGYNYRAKKWQIVGTISKVQPVTEWPENTREIMQGEPPEVFSRHGVASEPAPQRKGRK
jgi:hypothetical protein